MANRIVCSDGTVHTDLSSEEVMRILAAANADASAEPRSSFGKVLDDILAGRISSAQDVQAAFDSLENPPLAYTSFLIARPGDTSVTDQLYDDLAKFFPNTPIARRGDDIVLLLSRSDRAARLYPDFDDDALNALLTRHRAAAAVGNASSRRENIASMYNLAVCTLDIGSRLNNGRDRLLRFEDYAEYIMIDMCAKAFSVHKDNGDLVPLTNPFVARLFRYDLEHGDNLVDILYYYCLNNCNVAKTAAAVYMHRNTVASKIAKIRSLVDLDLSDGELQQRVIFSYKVLRYMEHYLDARVSTFFNIKP